MELRIKEVIKEKGLTITQVAERMGINRVNLSSMINGNPTVDTLGKIADALGVSVTEFFYTPNNNTPSHEGITIVCPHCHKDIGLTIKRNEEQP